MIHRERTAQALDFLASHGARLEYRPDWLAPDEARRLHARLLEGLEFDPPEVATFRPPFSTEPVPLPRREGAYGDPGITYTYSGREVVPRPWHPLLAELRARLRADTGFDPNFVLVNHYRSGEDRLGWHADDEADLGPEPEIHSLSLGVARDFQLRRKRRMERDAVGNVTLHLEPGSLLVMRHPTNRDWQHQLPRRKRVAGDRLNLTWRRIVR